MRKSFTFNALLLAALIPACGGPDAPTSWDSTQEALEAGAQARAEREFQTAENAYKFVAEHSDSTAEVRYDALLRLGRVQAESKKYAAAESTFNTLTSNEYSEQLSDAGMKQIIDTWIEVRQPEQAESYLNVALNRFADQKSIFQKQMDAVEALKAGNEDALAEIGYAGGDD